FKELNRIINLKDKYGKNVMDKVSIVFPKEFLEFEDLIESAIYFENLKKLSSSVPETLPTIETTNNAVKKISPKVYGENDRRGHFMIWFNSLIDDFEQLQI